MKNRPSLICFFIYILLIPFVNRAQSTLRGKVMDAASRQPLESVTVRGAKGSSNHTLTDSYGNFILHLDAGLDTIRVSFIGYEAADFSIAGKAFVSIGLQPAAVNLSDVVVSEGRAPAKFNSLARIDLGLKPVNNTQELLRLMPGLFIAQHAGGGKAEQIFLRGFDCDHGTDVQVSVDGMPVNMVSHAHGQGYADLHFLVPETVNSIDFGAGPYYSSHGNLNTAGYVSFSTFNNISTSRVQVEAGRYNSWRTLAMLDLLKKNKEKQSAYIAADYHYTDGATENRQHFNRLNLFGKYNLAVSRATQITASLSAFNSRWDASGQVPERAVSNGTITRFGSIDPSEGGNTSRYNANLVIAHSFANDTRLENQFYFTRYQFDLFSNFTFFLNDPLDGDEIEQAEKRNLFGYAVTLKQQRYFGNFSLKTTYGANLRIDDVTNSRLLHVVDRQVLDTVKLGDITELNASAYVQEQVSWGKWVLDAGLRLDYLHFNYRDQLPGMTHSPGNKSIICPKLNVQYLLHPKLQLYVKTGRGFHSNDARVVTANDGKEVLPAALGADFGLVLKPGTRLLVNVAAWYLHLDQEFVYVGDAGVIEPSGKTVRKGLEVTARYQLTKEWFANFNLNFTQPRAEGMPKGENFIPLAPTTTSTGGLFYKQQKGLNGSLTYRLIKNRPATENNSITARGYFITDAALNYTNRRYEIGLAIDNLFNQDWNEAQFATESRLRSENQPVTELNFTPGTPLFARLRLAVFF